MAVSVSVDRSARRVIAARSGQATLEQVFDCVRATLEHPEYEVGFDILFDLGSTDFIAEGRAARTVARFLGEHGDQVTGRVALVMPAFHAHPVSARYLAGLNQFHGLECRAFAGPLAALVWLGEPRPATQPTR